MTKSVVLPKKLLTSEQIGKVGLLQNLQAKIFQGTNSDGDQFSHDKSHSWYSLLTASVQAKLT